MIERANRFLIYRDRRRRWVVRNTRTGYYLPGTFPTWAEAYATAHRLAQAPTRIGFMR